MLDIYSLEWPLKTFDPDIPVNQDIRGFCFASKEEKGRIDKNLSFLADVFLGFIQNMKEICCFVLFAHNDKK